MKTNNKTKIRVLLLILLIATMPAAAQDEDTPGWLYNTPKAENNTYIYVVERGGGSTVNAAINNALLKVLRNAMMRIENVVNLDEVNKALQNKDADWGAVALEYDIPVNKVCEYVEAKTDKGYRVAVLCQVVKGTASPRFEEFNGCYDARRYNNGVAAIRSAFLPGLGQIGKRQYGVGILFMTSEFLLVGGTATLYYFGRIYLNYMKNSYHPAEFYNDYKIYNIIRTGYYSALCVTALIHVFNIVNAATITPKYKKNKLAFTPTLIPVNNTVGMGVNLTIKF